MIQENEPLAGGEIVPYENRNTTVISALTKGSRSTKIFCSVFVGCLLALSTVGTVVYFTVFKEKHQEAVNTTLAWTTTTTAATTPSPWTSWSSCSAECSSSLNPNNLECPTKRRYRIKQGKRETDITDCNCNQCWSSWSSCSAECSSSLNPNDIECPTKKRYRTKQGRRETDTTDCNCVQCPFRFGGQWYFDGCRGSHDCRKDTARYCQMVTPSGKVLHDSRTEKIYDKGVYKCEGGWKQMSYSHWNNYCGRNCSGTCKRLAIGCP